MEPRTPLLSLAAALVGLLVLAGTSGAVARVGIGKMSVTPNRVTAGTSGNDLTFTFLADSGAMRGTTTVDVARAWTRPQRTNPSGPGYVELQPAGCDASTRIAGIVGRRITIATSCARRHDFRLLYHRATAPQLSADGYVFLTRSRPAGAGKKITFLPLGPRKQPVVRVRGAAASALFITSTSVAAAGVPFNVTVRAIDPYGNNAVDYTGTITLTSTDPAATLPAPYSYGSADSAQHTFTGVVLRTVGKQRITATDSHGFTLQGPPVTVSPFSG